jgi:hypothetical protein
MITREALKNAIYCQALYCNPKTFGNNSKYRGFSPYATFGTWKNSHQPKIALGKFLPYGRSNKINSKENCIRQKIAPKLH